MTAAPRPGRIGVAPDILPLTGARVQAVLVNLSIIEDRIAASGTGEAKSAARAPIARARRELGELIGPRGRPFSCDEEGLAYVEELCRALWIPELWKWEAPSPPPRLERV